MSSPQRCAIPTLAWKSGLLIDDRARGLVLTLKAATWHQIDVPAVWFWSLGAKRGRHPAGLRTRAVAYSSKTYERLRTKKARADKQAGIEGLRKQGGRPKGSRNRHFSPLSNSSHAPAATFIFSGGSNLQSSQISIGPGGGLSAYHRQLAEAYPNLRVFVHADPGDTRLPALCVNDFDQSTLRWAIKNANEVAVRWFGSPNEYHARRFSTWIAKAIRKPKGWFTVIETTAA